MRRPKAIVFDRDGTLIEQVPYLSNPERVKILEGVREAIDRIRSWDMVLFLHTNQSGIGRGMFSMNDAHACNDRMLELLGFGESLFMDICIAPEHPDEPSRYRKPSPQFAWDVAARFGLSLDLICYVGDRGTDLQTADLAGTQGVGVATGLDDLQAELKSLGLEGKYAVRRSLAEIVDEWALEHQL